MDWKTKADSYKSKKEIKLAISRMIRNRDKTNTEHTKMFNYLFKRYIGFLNLKTAKELHEEEEKLEAEEKEKMINEAIKVFTAPLVI